MGDKPIAFSIHSKKQMSLRGATQAEVRETIWTSTWQPVRKNRQQARKTFDFGKPSPVNQQVYAKKTVHAIFVDEPGQIVVVTVLVYYHDQ
ncbi:MAG: hypothetical protein MAG451_00344 [Anaerolineales bacterium]|nr:hypothetical protein [Anaerolineales bacterium]